MQKAELDRNKEITLHNSIEDSIYNNKFEGFLWWPPGFGQNDPTPWSKIEQAQFILGNRKFLSKKIEKCRYGYGNGFKSDYRYYDYLCYAYLSSKKIFNKSSSPSSPAAVPPIVFTYEFRDHNHELTVVHKNSRAYDQPLYSSTLYDKDPGSTLQSLHKILPTISKTGDPFIPMLVTSTDNDIATILKTMPIDDLKEFLSISSSKSVQVAATLEFFSRKSAYLNDPQYLSILQELLFEDSLIKQAIDETGPVILERLKFFFNQTIEQALITENVATAANLFWIATLVQTSSRLGSPTYAASQDQIVSAELYGNILKRGLTSKNKQSWPVLLEALAASSEYIFLQTPRQDELCSYALLVLSMTKNYPVGDSSSDRSRTQAALMSRQTYLTRYKQKFIKHKDTFKSLFNQHICPIFHQLYPQLRGEKFVLDKETFVCGKDLSISLNRLDMTCSPELVPVTYSHSLPEYATNLLIEEGIYQNKEECASIRCYTNAQGVYMYDHEKDIYCTITGTEPQKVSIQDRRIDDTFTTFEHILRSQNTLITYKGLKNSYLTRVSGKKVYLCDPLSGKKVYEATQNGSLKKGNHYLLEIEANTHPFRLFEDPSCIVALGDFNGNIKEFEFPRYGLALSLDKDNKWCWKGKEEWTLADDQSMPYFGADTGCLVFENKEGKKKVLFPNLPNSITDHRDRSLNPEYRYNFQADQLHTLPLMECELIGGKAAASDTKARFALARYILKRVALTKEKSS